MISHYTYLMINMLIKSHIGYFIHIKYNRGYKMDVLKEIKKQHDEFKKIVERIEKASGDKKRELFNDLYAQVKGHHEAEEKVLFHDMMELADAEGKEMLREMTEEHSICSYQLSLLYRTNLDNETWDAKFYVLKEVLTHHLDEEELEFLKLARELMDKKMLEAKYETFE